jgi:hypothetical protein
LAAENPNYLEAGDATRRMTTAVKKNLARYFPDEMRFLRDWQVVGPFDNSKRDAIIVAPQLQVTNGAFSLDGKLVPYSPYRSNEGFIDFREVFRPGLDLKRPHYAYAYTRLQSARPQIVKFYTDSYNPFKIWLNGQLVYSREGADADCPDKRQAAVQLIAGGNDIVVMVAQGGISSYVRWGFWLRLASKGGQILDPEALSQLPVKDDTEVRLALKAVQERNLPNLVPNPSLSGLTSVQASSFGVWPPAMREKVSMEGNHENSGKGAVKFTAVVDATFNRFFKVRPGEKYLAGFSARNPGQGVCYLHFSWRNKGIFLEPSNNQDFFGEGGADWEQIAGVITIPEDVDEMTFCVSVSGQSADESCYVTDLFLYKLP